MKKRKNCFVILSGGDGERLWPLSRKKRPKQFIPFLDGKSLLEQTVDRLSDYVDSKENIGVVTNISQVGMTEECVGNKVAFIFEEEEKRNTGPAILYACMRLAKTFGEDKVVVFLPSDSFVLENEKYTKSLELAIEYAEKNDKIVTLGVMPTRPATGYGYIQAFCKNSRVEVGKLYDVLSFHEKPCLELAKRYLHDGNMFWNISVFAAKISVFIEQFKKHSPSLYEQVEGYFLGKSSYSQIDGNSIDYAVMEKSKEIAILTCDFTWYDIGNLDVFLKLQEKQARDSIKVVNIDAADNLVQILPHRSDKRVVAFVGVKNICLVQNEDITLVANRRDVEKVKKVIKKIKSDISTDFL